MLRLVEMSIVAIILKSRSFESNGTRLVGLDSKDEGATPIWNVRNYDQSTPH